VNASALLFLEWAGIAVAAALAACLYFLRPPARRVIVPSSLIWQQVLKSSGRRNDRLRWWLSLALACTITALLAWAVFQALPHALERVDRVIIVIDNSPTMATHTSSGATRLGQAKAQAAALIASLSPAAQVMVADSMRQIPLPAFQSPERSRALLDSLSVRHGVAPVLPAVPAATQGAWHIFGDGVLLRAMPQGAALHSVFEAVENVGITCFDVKSVPGEPGHYEAFLELYNAGGSPKRVEAMLSGKGAKPIALNIAVPAHGGASRFIDVSSFDSGPLRAALSVPGDGLTEDDVAYAFLPLRREIRLTLVTHSNSYLEKALAVLPRVRLKVVAPAAFRDDGQADGYVFDRYAPPAPASVPALLVRPSAASWLPQADSEVSQAEIGRWDRAHPVMENLSLRDLHLDRMRLARFDGVDARILARTRERAPLIAVHDAQRRWIWVGFALDESNFALHAAFPVFLSNAVNWMTAEPLAKDARLGMVELPLADARVIAMDGSEAAVQRVPGAVRFEADAPGIYTAVSAQQRVRVAVNLLDSVVTQVNDSSFGAMPAAAPTVPGKRGPPWSTFVLAAVLLLALEWLTYQRRLTE
jgi:hypothetical protein